MEWMDLLALAAASGLAVLIWMVQLLVYPSFRYYTREHLLHWHTTYTPRITVIVAPLMLVQLIIAITRLYHNVGWFETSFGLLVAAVWLITFYVFIPMHDRIQKGDVDPKLLQHLVSYNWSRTVIWSLLFILELVHILY